MFWIATSSMGAGIGRGVAPDMPAGASNHGEGSTAVGMELSTISLFLAKSYSPEKLTAKAACEV